MNITVEDLSPCRKRLRVEVPANRVNEELARVTDDYIKHVRIPGFRPGKAPKAVVQKRYQKEIEGELQRSFLPKAFREACQKRSLQTVSYPEFEDVSYQPGLSLSFSTVVDTFPEFSVPTYKGLALEGRSIEVTAEELREAQENVLQQFASFNEVTDRPLALGDFGVIKFNGTVEGQPIAELAPAAIQLATAEQQWLWIKPESFVPGFTEQLLGMSIGETRTATVTFPEDLFFEELKGKQGVYEVVLKGIKERHLPELTDEIAEQSLQCKAVDFTDKLRDGIAGEKKRANQTQLKKQVADLIDKSVSFELPESVVKAETQDVIQEIVSENQARGIPVNVLEDNKGEIFDNATRSAKEIVKMNYVLRKIAELEKIAITNDELGNYVYWLAMQHKKPVDKLVKQLSESGGLRQIEQRLLVQKVMDFIIGQANVTTT
jgi:trigger factor